MGRFVLGTVPLVCSMLSATDFSRWTLRADTTLPSSNQEHFCAQSTLFSGKFAIPSSAPFFNEYF
jgi:hypothetical protein